MIIFEISGNPVTKKNSMAMAVNRKTGRTFPVQSKAYKEYEKSAMKQLADQMSDGPFPINDAVNVECHYYMETHRKVDLCNLLAATCDILVKVGIIQDDNCSIVVGHDGSKVSYDKENPRVKIMIWKSNPFK